MHPGIVAERAPDRPAVILDTGERRTYAELDAGANRATNLFRALGLQPGDHVAFCVDNELEVLDLFWGAHLAGLRYTVCSTRLTADELAYIVDDCDAQAFVVSARLGELAQAIIDGTPNVRARYALGGAVPGHEAIEPTLAAQPTTPPADRVAGNDMLYSSGTTGRPKGIEPRGETKAIDELMIFTGVMAQVLGVGDGDVFLSPAPIYHAAPLRACMGVHQLGGTVVLMRKFDAERALQLIDEHAITHGQLVPTMFVRLLKLPDEVRARYDVSSLRGVFHAGAPCPVEIKQRMLDWWGPIIHEYYASTEGCGLTWATPQDWLAHPGTVGRAVVGVPHIVGVDGEELPAGEAGSIWFSDGPEFAYHKDPKKTAEAYDDRGWAHFGDIGRLDDEGFLYLTDRKSHMIITGGVNVYPQEAENALIEHPAVSDAAVFGIPHEEWGEEVKAVVQPMEMPADDEAAAALEAELIAHCRSRLADLKCPRSIDFRAELPRHETGKLYKRKLVDEYRARV